MDDTFPDLGALTDQELKELIDELTVEEQEVSYRRRILHGKIDILRAELVNRLRKKHEAGESAISGADVQALTRHPVRQGDPGHQGLTGGRGMHCPECGFVNPEGANYCQKCGAFLPEAEDEGGSSTTAAYQLDETGDLRPVDIDEVVAEGATLVDPLRRRPRRRSLRGQGRPHADRPQPRRRGVPRRRDRLAQPRAAGSPPRRALRRRPRVAERDLREPPPDRVAQACQDGDELQVGKYKLTYLER